MPISNEKMVDLLRDIAVFLAHIQTQPDLPDPETIPTAEGLEERVVEALDEFRLRRLADN